MSDFKFVVDKEAGGWWFVREVLLGRGRTKEGAIAECHRLNERRLDSKKVTAQMANKEYRQAKKSFPEEPAVFCNVSRRRAYR